MNKLKVAAYCRVSTDKDDQLNSLENQRKYFNDYIKNNKDWKLVRVYYDEGVSGTSLKKRDDFNCMIEDARNKKIDFILTKTVSRFARNTVDILSLTRDLKAQGIGVFFIADNINSLDNDAEFKLSLMGSIAQEESRRISENVKWGQLRSMEEGVVFGNNNMQGMKKWFI